MLNLQVNIDASSGFCFGVIYAVEMAEDILDEEHKLYCLGDIVHNDEEIARLAAKGLEIISHDQLKVLRDCKVLIRAHGEPSATYQIALENNIELIDASCPVVLKLQNRIKNSYDKQEDIYIYGKHGHAEIIGLQAQTSQNAIVFENFEEIENKVLPNKLTLYSQTTKSTAQFYDIKTKLEAKGIEVSSNDTICRQVSNRDHELKNFAARYDVIIFVSGKKSSNGKVLFNVCKAINESTYFVSKFEDIDLTWFQPNSTVGICGATSTPMWLMEKIKLELTVI